MDYLNRFDSIVWVVNDEQMQEYGDLVDIIENCIVQMGSAFDCAESGTHIGNIDFSPRNSELTGISSYEIINKLHNHNAGDDDSYNINNTENYANNRFSAGDAVNWTIFDGFSVRINKQRFEELEQLSKQNTAIMVEGTIQSVILAYYDVLLQFEKLKNWEEVMQLSSDRYNLAEERKAFGTYVTYDVLQAKNAYLTDRSGYLLQEINYKNSLRDLNFLLAEQNEVTYTLTDSFKAVPVE